jgi:hypothetical protein
LAVLEIKWESVQHVSPEAAPVVTGQTEEEVAAQPQAKLPDVPMVIFVCDPAGCEGFDKLQEVVFKKENVALGMKAFRTVKMLPSDVEKDPLLKDQGTEVPRLLIYDPVKSKVTVLEKNKLTAAALFAAMKKVADPVFGIDLDKRVKDHLKLLTERDQLANREKVITDKETRLAEDADKNAKDIKELQKDREEVTKQLQELATKEDGMWKLTPKAAKAA